MTTAEICQYDSFTIYGFLENLCAPQQPMGLYAVSTAFLYQDYEAVSDVQIGYVNVLKFPHHAIPLWILTVGYSVGLKP